MKGAAADFVPAVLQSMTPRHGMNKPLAESLGITTSRLSEYRHGKRTVPDYVAERILDRIRADELALADRIEAEINDKPPPVPAFHSWCGQCERRVSFAEAAACQSQWCKAMMDVSPSSVREWGRG